MKSLREREGSPWRAWPSPPGRPEVRAGAQGGSQVEAMDNTCRLSHGPLLSVQGPGAPPVAPSTTVPTVTAVEPNPGRSRQLGVSPRLCRFQANQTCVLPERSSPRMLLLAMQRTERGCGRSHACGPGAPAPAPRGPALLRPSWLWLVLEVGGGDAGEGMAVEVGALGKVSPTCHVTGARNFTVSVTRGVPASCSACGHACTRLLSG